MLKIILMLIMLSFSISGLFAQTMVIKKDDGSYEQISLTDSVVFYNHPVCDGTPKVYYEGGSYNDSDGNGDYYSTVLIGGQCWMKENLNVGTRIDASGDMDATNGTIEKYCSNDIESNCDTLGGLYQWDEAMQNSLTEEAQGICPPGWHIPTLAEMTTLNTTVSDDSNALKVIGEGTGDGAGTNTSGFSALLSGYRGTTGNFLNLGFGTLFWSSTLHLTNNAHYMYLFHNTSIIALGNTSWNNGFSVRCLQD